MNERIRLLAEQADNYAEQTVHYYNGQFEGLTWEGKLKQARDTKFAELLIKECIERGNDLAKHYINNHSEQEQVFLLASIADYSNEIKKHFGVEE